MTQTQREDEYEIRDLSLAKEGHKAIDWAKSRMPVLTKISQRLEAEKPLKDITLGACLHVTKETAVLMLALQAGGADIHLCASNPLSTQDYVAAALVENGIKTFAWKYMNTEGYYRSIANVIRSEPNITLDDGADVVGMLHKVFKGEEGDEVNIVKNILGDKTDWLQSVYAGAEETTTGIIRLRAMAKDGALLYPVFATNDTPTKWEFDNLWGTGQSTLDGILRATADLIASKVFVIAGYGHCGRGVALRAKGMGARRVIVTEINPHRALTAAMEGIEVMPMREAAKLGDIFVTATGCNNVIRKEHFELMKDGVVLSNTGHFNVEISLEDLESLTVSKQEIRPLVAEHTLKNGNKINLLAEGRLVNLACAEGHPSEVMDLSFADQALTVEWISKNREEIAKQGGVVIPIPESIDVQVAKLKCDALGIFYDNLTQEQDDYLTGWREGTQ